MFDYFVGLLQELLTFFYNLTTTIGFPSYGIAIILLTILIKMILYPLTVKQVKSMKAMQELQPKMKAIQEKYKGNPQKAQQELGKLYKDMGVNPLAGCLPLLIQMPFLIGIFYAIRDYSYVSDPSFLWIANLAATSNQAPLDYILPILSGLTTYYMQKQTTTDMSNPQNKTMITIMPLFIGWLTTTFPAGLGLYWVVGNAIQIAQQWFMFRSPGMVKEEAKS